MFIDLDYPLRSAIFIYIGFIIVLLAFNPQIVNENFFHIIIVLLSFFSYFIIIFLKFIYNKFQ